MAKHLNKATSTILIVGCGTWGSSTTLHLVRRGYKHVTVLDPYEVPSPISAGNDINKIAEQGMPPTCHQPCDDANQERCQEIFLASTMMIAG